ncbi:hypothetical protein [Spirosoma fluviale]|uniref:Uncharacterized protein n=1 Tax=Spirosoma fluviale TaxID=1597977 RepID=A0A286FCG4_9BACT|nr:hypothetical protein [Spirosoma fluviale]SOD80524.1 hypothetical protein SAMN06269250_1445 [Spirosoma fluviale]
MRQSVIFLLITGALTCAGTVLFGQSKSTPVSFPTYNQIKPAGGEIMDYVPSPGSGKIEYIKQKMVFNLFDYPAGTVTYIINGKPATNEKAAKEVVSKKGNYVTKVAINEPTEDGMITIYIDFTTDK